MTTQPKDLPGFDQELLERIEHLKAAEELHPNWPIPSNAAKLYATDPNAAREEYPEWSEVADGLVSEAQSGDLSLSWPALRNDPVALRAYAMLKVVETDQDGHLRLALGEKAHNGVALNSAEMGRMLMRWLEELRRVREADRAQTTYRPYFWTDAQNRLSEVRSERMLAHSPEVARFLLDVQLPVYAQLRILTAGATVANAKQRALVRDWDHLFRIKNDKLYALEETAKVLPDLMRDSKARHFAHMESIYPYVNEPYQWYEVANEELLLAHDEELAPGEVPQATLTELMEGVDLPFVWPDDISRTWLLTLDDLYNAQKNHLSRMIDTIGPDSDAYSVGRVIYEMTRASKLTERDIEKMLKVVYTPIMAREPTEPALPDIDANKAIGF